MRVTRAVPVGGGRRIGPVGRRAGRGRGRGLGPRQAQHPADVDLIGVGDPGAVQRVDLGPAVRIAQVGEREARQGVTALHGDQSDGIGDDQAAARHQRRQRVLGQRGIGLHDAAPARPLAVVALGERPQVVAGSDGVPDADGRGVLRDGRFQDARRLHHQRRWGRRCRGGRCVGQRRGRGERDGEQAGGQRPRHAEAGQPHRGPHAAQQRGHLDQDRDRPPRPGQPPDDGERQQQGPHIGGAPQLDRAHVGEAHQRQQHRRPHEQGEHGGGGKDAAHHRLPR